MNQLDEIMENNDFSNDNDDDIIVEEIDVFLAKSPFSDNEVGEMSSCDYYLMQYPGRWNDNNNKINNPDDSMDGRNTNINDDSRGSGSSAQQPLSVKIKPRHKILEAEYVVQYNNTTPSGYNKNNNAHATTTRTYESQTIPINTHLCFGKFITSTNNTTELILLPISHISQMRPSFYTNDHVASSMDDEYNNNSNDLVDNSHEPYQNEQPVTTSSITYQRKESDRAMAARRSSYAYQKNSQDSEPYIALQIVTNRICRESNKNLLSSITNAIPSLAISNINDKSMVAKRSSSSQYVQSLNYLSSYNNKIVYNNNVPVQQLPMDVLDTPTLERKRVVQRLTSILQSTGGPIPFSILLLSITLNSCNEGLLGGTVTLESQQNDHLFLLSILNTIAVLVRGNWYIHSKFMKIISQHRVPTNNSVKPVTSSIIVVGSNNYQQQSNKKVQQRIRTFGLLLLHDYGTIFKSQFMDAVNQYSVFQSTPINQEIFTVILHQIAKVTKDGYWICKIEDDTQFQQNFADVVRQHDNTYWSQQRLRFVKELHHYKHNTLN